jgi:hypothetical protein
MSVLSSDLRKALEDACVRGRRFAEEGCRAELGRLGIVEAKAPTHLDDDEKALRRGLRAKRRQLGDGGDSIELLLSECAYEQWHRLLFARFLAENGLLIHPDYRAPVTLAECAELASELEEPDAWAVAARFAAEILPGIFRLDDPCVRLRLAPESRLALEAIVEALPQEVFTSDDGLGWVYQYWQREKKDEVNASERKIGGADLGPVTQLFTENYMVRFLLENSLGAWWASRHPESLLQKKWEYLRFDEGGKPAAGSFDGWPERAADVTVMDPCCGSGHFLVEAFGMLWRMRAEEEGLTPVAAQDAVLAGNLFGLELDPRCVQIAMFAVALGAWKAGGGWRELPVPNIACSGIPVKTPVEEWKALAHADARLEQALEALHVLFKDADTLGSLIDPRRAIETAVGEQVSFESVEWDEISALLEDALAGEAADPATAVLGADAAGIARAAGLLARSFTLDATNVPFLSRSKQSSVLRTHLDTHFSTARGDLATAMMQRWIERCRTVALVTPQNWHEKPAYTRFRERVLRDLTYELFARVGNNAWQTRSGKQPFKIPTVLSIISSSPPDDLSQTAAVDIGNSPIPEKPTLLRNSVMSWVSQRDQLNNPDSRITMIPQAPGPRLTEYASAYQGVKTGDDARYRRSFWEVDSIGQTWCRLQSSVVGTAEFGGMDSIILWEQGKGSLAKSESARIQGQGAWGKRGVLVAQMGDLWATLFVGEMFDSNASAIVPRDPRDLAAIWMFCSNPEYRRLVRAIDNNVAVTNATLTKVPFTLDHWGRVAEEAGPLPEPGSDDPTQWLFEGRPEVSTEPLQVAVGRLLGYRWPEQPESDDLTELVDRDGLVCLPSVLGERPAAARLQELLARAYGATWSPARTRELLAASGSKKTDLDSWLRNEFFKAHCQLFKNRPFIWHIWDGRKDGFSALVNYHRLDGSTLRRLAYTYLGDWIERQEAASREGLAGAEARLVAAKELQRRLALILEGEPPHDIFVRWKPLSEQPLGWDPDLNDGIRLNVRPFVEAGVLRAKFNVNWNKDRGKNPDGSERLNDLHVTLAEKRAARAGVSA